MTTWRRRTLNSAISGSSGDRRSDAVTTTFAMGFFAGAGLISLVVLLAVRRRR